MSRTADPELVAAWRETLRQFEASGLSQRAFCEAEDLSLLLPLDLCGRNWRGAAQR